MLAVAWFVIALSGAKWSQGVDADSGSLSAPDIDPAQKAGY
jgi:hypothetical protein